ncbi:MAG: hypothetical protein FJ202_08490 [Gemmatimonadetes bacterium]|nr:hypothetical protein [Gemmatimonadota bacterium]
MMKSVLGRTRAAGTRTPRLPARAVYAATILGVLAGAPVRVSAQSVPATPAPASAQVAGRYSVDVSYGGQALNVLMSLFKREDGTYGGSVLADQPPEIPLANLKVEGAKVTATMPTPDGVTVTMEFTVTGDELTGTWKGSNGDGSTIKGRRIP